MREIKQVELWSKFRKFVPQEFQDEICPRPSDEVLKNIKKIEVKRLRPGM